MRPVKLVPVAAALALAACVPNRESLEFFELCGSPEFEEGKGCVYPEECETFLGDGRPFVDVGVAGILEMQIEMHNNLFQNEDQSSNRVTSSDLTIEEWRFEYAGAYLGEVTVPTAITVPARAIRSPIVPLVPPVIADLLRVSPLLDDGGTHELTADVYAVARVNDGTRFTSGPFRVTIEVCDGCFVAPVVVCKEGEAVVACPRIGQSATFACFDPN